MFKAYDPNDLIEFTARRERLRNWLWAMILFFLTR